MDRRGRRTHRPKERASSARLSPAAAAALFEGADYTDLPRDLKGRETLLWQKRSCTIAGAHSRSINHEDLRSVRTRYLRYVGSTPPFLPQLELLPARYLRYRPRGSQSEATSRAEKSYPLHPFGWRISAKTSVRNPFALHLYPYISVRGPCCFGGYLDAGARRSSRHTPRSWPTTAFDQIHNVNGSGMLQWRRAKTG